jgi:uncharacterized membrane protein
VAAQDGHGTFSPVIFSATLTPHRSLGRAGFLALMAGIAVMWCATGAFLLALGAWPVLPFVGVDFLAIWLAFRLSYRAGRSYEEIEVRRDAIVVRKVSPGGREREFRFNPAWTRLAFERDEGAGVTRIVLTSRGAAVPVGAFLNPDDRTSFADALGGALAEAKR